MIAQRQQANPVVWKDLIAMVEALRKFQAGKVGLPTHRVPSADEIKSFLAEEETEGH